MQDSSIISSMRAEVDSAAGPGRLLVALLLAAATLLAHGWSLTDGLFLDDHWHQAQLRERGWSIDDLLHSTTIEPDKLMETWWQEHSIRWQYARPVSVLLMKAVHAATGGSIIAQHAISLGLHFIGACLVYVLCTWLTSSRWWSIVGGLLFVIYSHSVFAVSWLAAQNMVLQTTLLLAAMLLYVRASGLNLATNRPVMSGDSSIPSSARPPPLRRPLFAAGLFLWILALFSRENAVMLPVILAGLDLAFGGRRHLRARIGPHLLFVTLAGAFIIWRLIYFYHPVPDVYLRRPDGESAYLLWCLAKLMHYLCSAVWLSPMTVGPTGRLNPFTEAPGDCFLMFAILAVMGVGYYLACRGARGYWIWPLWMVLSFLPVVPILATPHSGYLAGVAFAVAMVLGPGLRDRIRPVSIGRWSRPVAIWFLIATTTYIPIYRTLWSGMLAAEKYTIETITAEPAPADATDIFFINSPFMNIYAKLCLQESWGPGVADIRCHALTYAPDLVRMEGRCRVEHIDPYRFSVAVEGAPYFSGLLGRFLIDSVRDSGPLRTGEFFSGALFDAKVVEAGSGGVRKIEFTFHKPLASREYCFYLTTEDCVAARIRFPPPRDLEPSSQALAKNPPRPEDIGAAGLRLAAGDAAAAETLFAGMESDHPAIRRRSWRALQAVVLPVARAVGAPLQALFAKAEPAPEELKEIRTWYLATVDNPTLAALWVRRNDFEAIREARDGIFTVREIASRIIRRDLYLTGPPFPGPR